MMDAIERLTKARNLITPPKSWCKGSSVRFSYQGEIVARCAMGALAEMHATMSNESFTVATAALVEEAGLRKLYRHDYVARWKAVNLSGANNVDDGINVYLIAHHNDGDEMTHEGVLAWFDRTIAMLRTRAQIAALLDQALAAAQPQPVQDAPALVG